MYIKVGIALAVLVMLYKFFGQKFILVLLAIFFVLLGLVYWNQHKILYIPVVPNTSLSPRDNPFGYRHPSQKGCSTDDVVITTADNVKIRGWLIKNENNRRLIIYFHQNAGNLGFRIPFAKLLHQNTNSDVLFVAYRGFSDSQGTPSQEGLQRDSEAILEWANQYKNRKLVNGQPINIYVLGRSLGGAVTVYISTHEAYSKIISGLILQNTFTNIKDMISFLLPILAPFSFIRTNFWPSIQRVPRITQPILFIRSLKDQIVPTQQMLQLINAAVSCQFKMEYQITRGTHNVAWEYQPEKYVEQLLSFFNRIQSK